ncbi:uncharacterized protein LOC126983048 isoform X4 [Eriocheir sinensis]|uniref:uncharacterized protein LOC126983048 isoform X4 n=1 Tax=Eriocheir sinensis TaxID=95602 RepID=UPI0021C8C1FB|nr:uncharacterized protein LOC126983048 isoform X4 [Eriocheir sinensis]
MCKCSFVLVACLALACLASAQQYGDYDQATGDGAAGTSARSTDSSLIFNHNQIVVNPGDPVNLDCGVRGESRYCIWESDNGQIYQVEDVYGNVYDGLSKPENTVGNECGIVINSADISHHGKWTCKVFVVGNSLLGSKNVVVTIKPTNPVLEIDSQRNLIVNSEEERPVVCSVAAARPAVAIRWYLGDTDITASAENEETPTDTGGIYKSVSTLRRHFQPMDNGKILMCSITHQTLSAPANTSVPVSVVFKPLEKPVTTFYQIQPGSDYDMKFNFSANPEPTKLEWQYGSNLDNPEGSVSIPGIQDRYSADLEDLGHGRYTAKLLIRGFTEQDAMKEYQLVAENEFGETRYRVKLSMHDAPQDGDSETSNHDKIPPSELSVSVFDETESNTLSGGAVAGIIIVLLVVVVAVVAAGYARYRQMFCFAPIGSPDLEEAKDIREEHSDTESARGPAAVRPITLKDRLGQLTQAFKKTKPDQDVKLDDLEKKSLTKDKMNKEMANKEYNPEEKELSEVTHLPEETNFSNTYCQVKSPYYEESQGRPLSNEILHTHPEGTFPEETILPQIKIEQNEFEMKEINILDE